MPRMTADERAQLDALSKRAQEEDAADSGFEVLVENKDGLKVKLTGAKARRFLSRNGLGDLDDEEGQEEGDEEEELPADDAPAGGDSYFRRRK